MLALLIDFILHVDVHLATIIDQFGVFTYLILFLIVFCETGLVITPFLPGDSLLFAAGALAARGYLHPAALFMVFAAASILGDAVNYRIGSWIGVRAFRPHARFLNHEHLERTQAFYERKGGKAIVIARFMPILRTFAPFVAGIARMHYPRFFAYNVFGGILWAGLFVVGGYLFGNIPFVEHNFSVVILAIVLLSLLPGIIEWTRRRFRKKRASN